MSKLMKKIESRLVPDWRDALRWNSTRAFGLLAALPIAWQQVPPEVQALVPQEYRPYLMAAIALCGWIGRITKQKGLQ